MLFFFERLIPCSSFSLDFGIHQLATINHTSFIAVGSFQVLYLVEYYR
jgi:hypothetical protein